MKPQIHAVVKVSVSVLLYLPNACDAFSRNIYIPATMELINNNPTLILQRCFLGVNLTYMNIMDYQIMWSINITNITQDQVEKLSHKLPNYSMVKYDSLIHNLAN